MIVKGSNIKLPSVPPGTSAAEIERLRVAAQVGWEQGVRDGIAAEQADAFERAKAVKVTHRAARVGFGPPS